MSEKYLSVSHRDYWVDKKSISAVYFAKAATFQSYSEAIIEWASAFEEAFELLKHVSPPLVFRYSPKPLQFDVPVTGDHIVCVKLS